MNLVIDANILFALLIRKGKTEDIFFNDTIKLYAPEFMLDEFEKYKDYIKEKTNRTDDEFDRMLSILRKKIELIPQRQTEKLMERAREICPDENDGDYFAVALELNCAIWSNDKKLKDQKSISVISTHELLQNLEFKY